MMADTRTTSVLDIKVRMAELGGLEKKLRAIFSNKTPREFNTAIGTVNRSIEKNVRHTNDLVRAMGKVGEGSKAYKRLAGELRGANKEGRDLERTLRNLNAAQARIGRSGGAGGGGAVAAGAGAPSGARIGAGGFGGMPQIPMPGVGAMAMGLSAFPVAGGLAAGSMMAAASAYQSRLRYEQAQLGAAPFLMHSRIAGGYSPSMRRVAMKPGEQHMAREAGTGIMAPIGEAGLTKNELATAFYQQEIKQLGGEPSLTGSDMEREIRMKVMRVTGLEGIARNRVEARILNQQKHLADMRRSSLAEAIGTPEQAADAAAARAASIAAADPFAKLGEERKAESARSGATKLVRQSPFDAAAFQQAGRAMGMGPAEALQMAGQMGAASGRPVSADEFRQALALQRTMGIDVGTTGAGIRGLRYGGEIGGQGGGNMQQIANMVGFATLAVKKGGLGLEGDEVKDYLRQQTGFLQQMVTQGIGVDIEAQRALEASIAGSGISAPWRAAEIGRGFTRGAANIGREGAGDATSFRLMQAFGFGEGGGGLEEYFQTRLGMQSGTLAQGFGMKSPQQAMSSFIEAMRVPGLGPAAQAGVLQQAFGKIGGQIGPQEAMALSQGMQAAAPGQYQIDTAAAERLVGTLAGATRAEAGLEGRRVEVGGESAAMMQKLSGSVINMAETFNGTLGPAVTGLAGVIDDASGQIAAAIGGLNIGMNP